MKACIGTIQFIIFKEQLEITCFSLASKLFKNMVLEKIKSGEEIAPWIFRKGARSVREGARKIPLGFLCRQVNANRLFVVPFDLAGRTAFRD